MQKILKNEELRNSKFRMLFVIFQGKLNDEMNKTTVKKWRKNRELKKNKKVPTGGSRSLSLFIYLKKPPPPQSLSLTA